MQKKLVLFFCLALLSLSHSVFSMFYIPRCLPKFALEVRPSYFRPNDSTFRDDYVTQAMRWDYDLDVNVLSGFWLWQSVGFYQKKGHATFNLAQGLVFNDAAKEGEEKITQSLKVDSTITLIPLTLGIKVYHRLYQYVDVFAGVGICWNYTKLRDHYDADNHFTIRHWYCGPTFIGGARFFLDHGAYAAPFIEYTRIHVNKERAAIYAKKDKDGNIIEAGVYRSRVSDVGGWKIGLGLGIVL